jgi:hypothetical protein
MKTLELAQCEKCQYVKEDVTKYLFGYENENSNYLVISCDRCFRIAVTWLCSLESIGKIPFIIKYLKTGNSIKMTLDQIRTYIIQ